MNYLFIAEKPSLMQEVRNVYIKYKNEIDKYINGEMCFVALAGHICGYAMPEDYPQWDKKWSEVQLPMIPNPWKIVVNKDKKQLYKEVLSAYKENHCNGIIVGTDSDVEGNGIFYLLEQKAGWSMLPTLRFYLDDQTEQGIKKAFLSMTDYHTNPRDVHMTESYLLRSQYDWLLGMNMTRGVTLKQGTLMRIGSVKAPTLKLIYDNCKAIDTFVPKTSYTIEGNFATGFTGNFVNEEEMVVEYEKKEDAHKEISLITSKKGTVIDIQKDLVKTNAPKLYNLSDLQIEAGSKYGYSPDKTLSLVQSLYETHKVMSYPRTDGKYISSEKVKELPDILNAIKTVSELSTIVGSIGQYSIFAIKSKKMYVNDEEVLKVSHDALLPTHTIPDFEKMSQDEINIYCMVAKRLLSIFMPPLEEYKMKILIDVDNHIFKCTGSSVKENGWTVLVSNPRKKDVDFPNLQKDDYVDVNKIDVHEKVTSPPKRYTEATLIKAMVNIGSTMQDKEYKQIMKEVKGIGTQSSRASIIKELKIANYFTVAKQGIYITDIGKQYIECLIGYDIINPKLAAIMNLHMKHVCEGLEDYNEVKAYMLQEIIKMIRQLDEMQTNITPITDLCPICKGAVNNLPNSVSCSCCDFMFYKKIAGVTLDKEDIHDILTKKETKLLQGFISKSGKKFKAKLVVAENGKLAFSFDDGNMLNCPICGKQMHERDTFYGCSGYRDNSCHFCIGKVIASRKMSFNEIKTIVENGESPVLAGFVSKNKKKFKAKLVLDREKQKLNFKF